MDLPWIGARERRLEGERKDQGEKEGEDWSERERIGARKKWMGASVK